MPKFIIEPHFRLQEWVAEEKGYFRDEGLDYEFRELIRSSGGTHHATTGKSGAFQNIEQGREANITCACHWTVNVAASRGHTKLYADAYSVAPSAIFVPANSKVRSPADLVNLLKAHPGYEAIEGLNEPDFNTRTYKGFTDSPSTNNYAATRAFQNDMFAAINADPLTQNITVLSPAMGRSSNSELLAPISFDVAAMHSYPSAREPSFNLDTFIGQMSALRGTPAKPLMSTETGYFQGGSICCFARRRKLSFGFSMRLRMGIDASMADRYLSLESGQ